VFVAPTKQLTADHLKTEQRNLEGNWVVESATAGEDLRGWSELKGKRWEFANGKFRSFIGSDAEDGSETGEYRIDGSKNPKHLDLIPLDGDDRSPRKCIYTLDGDRLRIAWSFWFSPGTPKTELEEGKKMKARRPSKFDVRPQDLTFVVTLERQKKK
jgi:uncharacterized protein (TIGR03067 family)